MMIGGDEDCDVCDCCGGGGGEEETGELFEIGGLARCVIVVVVVVVVDGDGDGDDNVEEEFEL